MKKKEEIIEGGSEEAEQLDSTEAAEFTEPIVEKIIVNEDYLEQLRRVQADFENYKKRVEIEKGQIADYANAVLLSGLLDTLDNFERALESMENIPAEHTEGLKMVYNGMVEYLQSQELQKIKAHGCQFDPNLHEAIMQEESDQEDGTVLGEFQCGYSLKGKVIRPSKVKVARQSTTASHVARENIEDDK